MKSFGLPRNPVELAEIRAEQQGMTNGFEMTPDDERLLAELDFAADELGFLGETYFVESRRAMIVPASFESTQPVTHISFAGLCFEGLFATFSKVHIGQIFGHGSIRAVCLAFPQATLLPYFDQIEPGHLLYVPVLAVETMDRTSI